MATPKRKRTTTSRSKPSKRPKYVESSDEAPASEELWAAESILDEKRVGRKLQYLIQWKGIDPSTGETYVPTWEPQENPTPDLVAAWKQCKAERDITSASSVAEASRRKARPKKKSLHPRPSRKARVIESSPEPSAAHTTSALSRPSTPADETTPFEHPSGTTTTPFGAPSAKRPSPKIHVDRGNSFDPNEYERFSQLAASQPPSTEPSHTQESNLDSSQLFVARPEYRSSGVVADSQSSAGEGSFIPATQQTTGTTQQSSTVSESQEDVAEDSVRLQGPRVDTELCANGNSQGLREIVEQAAASRAPSPARSIPETIYDTTADSQSQRRRLASQERFEEPAASGTIDSTSLVVSEQAIQVDSDLRDQNESQVTTQNEERLQVRHTSAEQVAPPSSLPAVPQPSEKTSVENSDQQPEIQQQEVTGHQESILANQFPGGTSEPTAHAAIDQSSHHSDTQHHAAIAEPISAEKSQSSEQDQAPCSEKQSIEGVQETPKFCDSQSQASASQDITEASLTEHLVPDEAGQFPYHSQHPLQDPYNVAQPSPSQLARESAERSIVADVPSVHGEVFAQPEQEGALPLETSASGSIQASPNDTLQASQSKDADDSLVSSTQTEDEILFSQFLELEFTRSRSPTVAQQTILEVETVVQSTYDTAEEEVVLRRDFAFDSQTPRSTLSREQNAQAIPLNHDLSTQEDIAESIRSSVEVEVLTDRSTPDSRHDSSQDTPERRKSTAGHSSSPIAQPPSHSLPALDSHVPPRPKTPVPTSSVSVMATQDSGAEVRRQMKEALAKRQEVPFTPTRRLRTSKANVTPSATTPVPTETPNVADFSSNRHLLHTGVSPSVGATDGTRSPSTVPDRSPVPSAPTSLRTIALTRATRAPVEETREEADRPPKVIVEEAITVVPAIITTEPTVPEEVSSDNDVMSDASEDDTESLLNDELQLAVEEHIVPLFIDGRQSDDYVSRLRHDKDMLQAFLRDRDNFEPFVKIEELLSRLRAVETHSDLTFEEASSSHTGLDGASQIEWLRQYGTDNSAKFKFLNALFHTARDQEKHIVLVTENDNDALLNIIETFCKACFVQYNMPTKGRQSDPARVEGNLSVTILPSTLSPIIRPPDVVICLDGVHDAKVIRQKNWARNPDLDVVPVLHLVISRTVGHIERYLSSSLSNRDRAHTIVASLGNMLGQLGKPIDEDMPRAPASAAQVAGWLDAEEYPRDWPLGSIGSVKDVIEFQTQMSQASPAPERMKRPHDDEDFDPAKRMRLTPQPQGAPSSSINENEITRISDSMPGTAIDMSNLRAQVARVEETLQKERNAREAEQAHYREQEAAWDKQQTAHEDLTREYRILLGKQQSAEEKIATLEKNNENFRERLAACTTELRTRDEQLEEQRNTHALSEDAKIAEITKLRTDLAQAVADKERAFKSAATTDSTLDYTKEQYRLAQDAATTSAARVTELEAQVAKLSHTASGQPAKLKELHLGRQYDLQAKQIKSLKAENNTLKKTMQFKEDELARAKLSTGRPGVGTRATSATPQPNKVRSRATSPANRLSNLRNG
jgi:hypothetical protein